MPDTRDLLIDAEKVMRQCQRGTRNYQEANDLHAQCYGTIGALVRELRGMIADHGPRTTDRQRAARPFQGEPPC